MQKYYAFPFCTSKLFDAETSTQTTDKVHPLGEKLSSGRVFGRGVKEEEEERK